MQLLPSLFLLTLTQPAGASDLQRGVAALESFSPKEALVYLLRAVDQPPHGFEDYVKIYEQLGIAYAYLGRKEESLRAFDRLLAIAPGHAVRYTLSPKATFLFEEARRRARNRRPTGLHISWPTDNRTTDPIAVAIAVLADPHELLHSATLFYRLRGAPRFDARSVQLESNTTSVEIPAAGSAQAEVLELYLEAHDAKKSSVFRFGSELQPHQIPLRYEPPTPWYETWWVWAAGAGIVVAGASAIVFTATRQPPTSVDGELEIY